MKISELFEGGSTEAQKKKRMTFYTICVTLALLAVMLILLAMIGISSLIAQNANKSSEQSELALSIENTVSTSLGEDAIYSGTLLALDSTNRYKGEDETVTVRDREGRPKTDTNGNVYTISSPSAKDDQDFRATPETIDAFNAMIKEFYRASSPKDDNICIISAYSKIEKDNIPPLYTSGHTFELGYYVDYNTDPGNIKNIYGVEKYSWIYSNAHKYGFINLRAPDGSGTGVFRYIGIPHATYIKTKSIDFDTYLEQLRSATHAEPLLMKIGKITYASYFVSAAGEHLVPADYEYTVSGNNYDGYIITAEITETK